MTEENNIRILLIDDDEFLLDMYSLKFKSAGFLVDVSHNGKEAIKKIQGGYTPEIILLDIIMPTMDGLELLDTLHKEKLAESSVIVVLSNQADDEEKAKALGVDGFIVKAFNIPSEVVKKVADIYEQKK